MSIREPDPRGCLCLVAGGRVALLSANVVNFEARQISSDLHECGAIAVSVAIPLEATLIGTPAMLEVEQNPSALFLIRSVLVCIFCGGILLPIFLTKWNARAFYGNGSANPKRSGMEFSVIGNSGHYRRGIVAATRSDASCISIHLGISLGGGISGLGDGSGSLNISDANPGIQPPRRATKAIYGIVITNRPSRRRESATRRSASGVDHGSFLSHLDQQSHLGTR
jgi:hypothetical protein